MKVQEEENEEKLERRESAYAMVILLSLVTSLSTAVCFSTVSPPFHSLLSVVNHGFERDSLQCELSAREMRQLLLENALNTTSRSKRAAAGREDDECKCEFPPGPRGLPGRRGLQGVPGSKGARGEPARLPCEPPVDIKKICADPCPVGLQGPAGVRGIPGDRGSPGLPGTPGKRGLNGKIGHKGDRGPPGIPGLDGDVGDPGVDAVPMPFVPGPAGPEGERGGTGPPGPVGMPGIDGPVGPPGSRGRKGFDGLPGARGESGLMGPMGESGFDGNKGVCPTYCATDGGVFFVQNPDWFSSRR